MDAICGPGLRSIRVHLITNMVVSDNRVTALAVPRKITEILLGPRRWLIDGLLGPVLWKSVLFFKDITIGVSILSISAIAIEKPAKLCKTIIPAIWLILMGLQVIYCK